MMGAKSRRKGAAGELEVVHLLREHGLQAERGYHQARGGDEAPDVPTNLPAWIEVKRQARPNIPAAVAQAQRERGERPVWAVAFTRSDRGEWLVTMTADEWCDLVAEWRAGR